MEKRHTGAPENDQDPTISRKLKIAPKNIKSITWIADDMIMVGCFSGTELQFEEVCAPNSKLLKLVNQLHAVNPKIEISR